MGIRVSRTFDILDHYLAEYPRKDALGGKRDGKWYTYSTEEYYNSSFLFALGLLALGFKKGDKIATVTANCPEWNFVDMGMAMIGVVHVPVYPTIDEDEYEYIINHALVKMLIVGDLSLFQKLNPIAVKLPHLAHIYSFEDVEGVKSYESILKLGEENKDKLETGFFDIKKSIQSNDLATIIYTSGTTGIPKGVMLSHNNLVSNFLAHVKMHNLGKDHKVVSFLPLCHVYERSVNYHFQYKGMGIYYIGDLNQILPAIREIKPHMFNSVPRILEKLYDGFVSRGKELSGIKKIIYFWALRLTNHFEYNNDYNGLLKLKIRIADKLIYSKWRSALGGNIVYIVSGGAALQPRIARLFGMAKMLSLEGYGLTETSPVVAVNNPVSGEMKIGTVGAVVEGFDVKIADDGEILCKGPGVMQGYYNDPESTSEVIDESGWFHTGDIGNFVKGKYLRITDRKKEIFKLSGGKYIAPQMIENKLKISDFIINAIVVGANEKFASAIISPNFKLLHNWCYENKIQFNDNKEMVIIPEVIGKIRKEVNIINKKLGSYEQISRIRLVGSEWSPVSGELSPTLKLRRIIVTEKYKYLIDDIYSVRKN